MCNGITRINFNVSATDYYPFGMGMPGRTFNSSGYRFGFNGKENDNEVKGDGNTVDFGARIFDPRLGKFQSTDPYNFLLPNYSPYTALGNNPIFYIEKSGKIFTGHLEKLEILKYYLKVANDLEMLKIIEEMDKSPINFYIQITPTDRDITDNELNTGGKTSVSPNLNDKLVLLTIYDFTLCRDSKKKLNFATVSLMEEIFHGYQFMVGDIDFIVGPNGSGGCIPGNSYNLGDELKAGEATFKLWKYMNNDLTTPLRDYLKQKYANYPGLKTDLNIYSLEVIKANKDYLKSNPNNIIVTKDSFKDKESQNKENENQNKGPDKTYGFPDENEPEPDIYDGGF
jgi:RHS repeat-associated protein